MTTAYKHRTVDEIADKYDLDVLELLDGKVYMHMGRDLSVEEFSELAAEIERLQGVNDGEH